MLDGLPIEEPVDIPEEQEEDNSLPRIRKDLIIESAGVDEHGQPVWNVLDVSRNTFFRLSFDAHEILRYWYNHKDIDALVTEIQEKSIVDITKEDVKKFIYFLKVNNLVQAYQATDWQRVLGQYERTKKSIVAQVVHGYLFVKVPLVYPDRFLDKTYPWVRFFASKYFIGFLIFCAVVGSYLVSRQFDEFTTSLVRFFNLEGMLYYFIALVVAKISHEMGHAYATKSAGQRVSSMGMAFLVMFPVLYTDTTNVWRVRAKRKRLEIAAAGMLVELSLAIISLFVWSFLEDGPLRSAVFLLATVTWIMTLLVNLNPLMRFDGYYLFQDWLGVDNLQTKGFAHAKWYLRKKLFGLEEDQPEILTEKQHKWFLIYSYATWIYRFFLFLGIALLVYYFFFKLLGIFLFAVEIIWFIGRPIYKELKVWWGVRKDMTLNKYSVTSLLMLLGILILIMVPWRTDIELHSVYQANKYEKIFTPEPGLVQALYVKNGDKVEKDTMLFQVENDELTHEYRGILLQIVEKKVQQEAQTANENNTDTALILSQEIQSLRQELKGIQAKINNGTVKAGFSGTVYDVNKNLRKESWIEVDALLMQLIAAGPGKIIAYVFEKDFNAMKTGSEGMFYPNSISYPPFKVVVNTVNQSNSQVLEEESLASIYGGEIAVRTKSTDRGEVLVPEEAIYEVTLLPKDSKNITILRNQVGVVRLEGERRSFINRAWRQVASVLVRESGF